jgi:predicted Zn-dependent peptidase
MDKRFYPALGETVWHRQLENGLHIYVDEKPEYGKQFAFFATNYGGMDQRYRTEDGGWQDTPAGVAHFLEHKLFDTEDGNALQILAANGADNNAFTSSSITGYYFEGTRGFEENLETLLSFVSVPYFTQESVDKEQGIIAQEIRMGDDNPDLAIYYMLLEALYQNHPVRGKVIGSEQSIACITAETLYQCHGAFYHPGNMVLCVSGSVDAQQVADIAQRVLPAVGGSRPETDLGEKEPETVEQRRLEREMEVSAPQFLIGFKGEAAQQGGCLRQRLLAELVCDVLLSPSAPLYTKLYEEGLINNSFDSAYESVPGCAFLTVGGESRDPDQVLERVLAEAERVAREGIDPALWERQKKAAYGGMVRRLNSLEDTCIELAMSHFEGEDYLGFPDLYHQLERADGEALIRRWCVREKAAMAVIQPRRSEHD